MVLNLDVTLSIQLDILLIPNSEKDKAQNSPNPLISLGTLVGLKKIGYLLVLIGSCCKMQKPTKVLV